MTNVALVVLDTLRKDAFDRHFDWLPGRRFDRAYSTSNWTVPSHASLFTGRYPSEVGVHAKNLYFDCETPALAEELRDAGYTTRAFSANTNVSSHFDFDRGFDAFAAPEGMDYLNDENQFNWKEFNRTTDSTGVEKYLRALYACIRDDSATIPSLKTGFDLLRKDAPTEYGGATDALELIRGTEFGDREFLFLNLMEAHEPYRAPPEYRTVEEPDLTNSVGDISIGEVDGERTKRAYEDCVRYLSDIYREMFEHLSEEFDYVITLSDHGELLGEHGAWGHEYGVYPKLTHVPFVVSGEGLSGRSSAAASILDAHGTIQALADVDGESRGRNLLEPPSDGEFLAEYRGLTSWGKEKLKTNGYETEAESYDRELRGYVAPRDYYGFETLDGVERVGSADAPDAAAVTDRIRRLRDDLDTRDVERNNDVPDEIKDRLEDLGYA
ncbi:sulfatase-like hydrolase/transferase [Haladaptatus salinisoli]|uniref:sulfatase-like hydrolase/transferase n=1 Tax=Haladaptatus salinisoli TaxID=2884876 RepID=UPI001D0ADB3C|nr:sulfatase-like hydrolase/transferase [Haladaptatus salinisoli]